MNHYGIENFDFSILKDDFSSLEEMWQYEHNKIIEFDTTNPDKGYNNTDKTGPDLARENCQEHHNKIKQPCAKVDINENIVEIYESYHDAAEKNEYDKENNATKVWSVCKGYTPSCFCGQFFRDLDNDGKVISLSIDLKNYSYKNRKMLYGINMTTGEEKIFESVSAASKELVGNLSLRQSISKCTNGEIRYSVVHNWIFRAIDNNYIIIEPNLNFTIDQAIERYNYRNPEINGERKTIPEWCSLYNIKPDTYRYRVKNGWSPEKALKTPVRK